MTSAGWLQQRLHRRRERSRQRDGAIVPSDLGMTSHWYIRPSGSPR